MKRFRLLLAGVLMTVTLCLFVFASMASASPAHHCTSHWHVASSATIKSNLDGSKVGSVSLLRDGCGNIRATIHSDVVYGELYVYLTDAQNNTIGVSSGGVDITNITTATYHHYRGVKVSAFGQISQVAGDSTTIAASQTPYNSGA